MHSCLVQNVALACVRPSVPFLRSTRRSRYDAGGKDALTLFFSAFEKMRASSIPPSSATRMGRTVTSTVSTTFLPSISSTISCWWCPVCVCSFLPAALLGILMEMILAVDSAETRLLGNAMPTVFIGGVVILARAQWMQSTDPAPTVNSRTHLTCTVTVNVVGRFPGT